MRKCFWIAVGGILGLALGWLATDALCSDVSLQKKQNLPITGRPDTALKLSFDPGDRAAVEGGYGDGLNQPVNLGTASSPNWARQVTFPHSGSGGFIVFTPPLDITSFDSIVFQVKGAIGGERFDVRVIDGASREKRFAVDALLSSPGVTPSFKKAVIRFADLAAAGLDLTQFKEVSLESGSTASQTVVVDDAAFEKPAA